MSDPKLPRYALDFAEAAIIRAATDFGQDDIVAGPSRELARAALTAALGVIQRDAMRQAAKRIVLLNALSNGWVCPACHSKPATSPHAGERRTGYTCGCGRAWEPPKNIVWKWQTDQVVRQLAKGQPLPDLPPKEGEPS